VNTERYPDTVCGVVHDAVLDSNGNPKKNQCQFSWYCDGKSDVIKNKDEWYEALQIATLVYYSKRFDPTEGAIMYHATYVSPNWKKDFMKTVRIDEHIFYKYFD
jgi:spore germination cell wall hydrolase CwlJ-like protein